MIVLDQQTLKAYLRYEPDTGKFFWVKKSSPWVNVGDEAGCLSVSGYARLGLLYREYRLNRLAVLYMTGEFPPDGMHVDHINRIKTDNRWKNLRVVTQQENNKNREYSGFGSIHGVRTGIYLCKNTGKYRLRMHRKSTKEKIIDKRFKTREEAQRVRDELKESMTV